ncbi:MAG: hypothetical protein IPK39_10435 [Sulfuritalea sp.]|nr:hypothetical protein [Sulfuritalea sp.]
MAPLSSPATHPALDPAAVAAAWFAHFGVSSLVAVPREEAIPDQPLKVLAAFAAIALAHGRTLVILAPDDQQLPEISNALELAIRPLCLVLPAADFAARIALRATLSLMKSRLARDDEGAGRPPLGNDNENGLRKTSRFGRRPINGLPAMTVASGQSALPIFSRHVSCR